MNTGNEGAGGARTNKRPTLIGAGVKKRRTLIGYETETASVPCADCSRVRASGFAARGSGAAGPDGVEFNFNTNFNINTNINTNININTNFNINTFTPPDGA